MEGSREKIGLIHIYGRLSVSIKRHWSTVLNDDLILDCSKIVKS